jgi:hypothetical protein
MRRVTGECSENPSIQDACFAGPCRANCLALYWRGGGGGTDECTQLVPCDWEAHDANKSRKRSARSAVSLRPEPAVGQGLARISRTLGEWYGMGPWILALFAASQRARRRAKHGCPTARVRCAESRRRRAPFTHLSRLRRAAPERKGWQFNFAVLAVQAQGLTRPAATALCVVLSFRLRWCARSVRSIAGARCAVAPITSAGAVRRRSAL